MIEPSKMNNIYGLHGGGISEGWMYILVMNF